jgi:hypothetical protein
MRNNFKPVNTLTILFLKIHFNIILQYKNIFPKFSVFKVLHEFHRLFWKVESSTPVSKATKDTCYKNQLLLPFYSHLQITLNWEPVEFPACLHFYLHRN